MIRTTATYRSSVTANMNLIGERFFWYRYCVQCDRCLSCATNCPIQVIPYSYDKLVTTRLFQQVVKILQETSCNKFTETTLISTA